MILGGLEDVVPAVYQDRTRAWDRHYSLVQVDKTPGTFRYRLVRPGSEVELGQVSGRFPLLRDMCQTFVTFNTIV